MLRLGIIIVACLPVAICSYCTSVYFSAIYQQARIFNRQPSRCQRPKLRRQMFKSGSEDQILSDDKNDGFGLYVHIPFCRRRCNYCDFAIVPIGKNSSSNVGFEKMNQEYTDAVLTELSMISASSSTKIPLRSIYFGGGTPSLAPLTTLETIMEAICGSEHSPFRLEQDAEVTIEMDPGTFDLNGLTNVKKMGFNRISLGVQSLDDTILATLGRVHRSLDVYKSIDIIREVYGEDANYSVDLISGVPGLTLAGWTETLYKTVRLHPRPLHVSLYDLQVEMGTAFWKWYDGGNLSEDDNSISAPRADIAAAVRPELPTSEECAWMYRYASGYLRSNGFEHYEISSYAHIDPNAHVSHRSKHNQIYWETGGQWYALGLGATSNLNGVRFARPRALSDYLSWALELKKLNGKLPLLLPNNDKTAGELPENDELLDIVMTRLRTSDGLDLDWIANNKVYGETYVSKILEGFKLALDLDLGTITTTRDRKHGILRLRDPNGFLFSNNIISNIFLELDSLVTTH